MKRISSDSTTFHKKIFPLIWFGGLAFIVVMVVTKGAVRDGHWMLLAMPCLMAVFGFFLMKKLVWDLADEVHDCGDSLLVRKGGEEERIALSNIMNVSLASNSKPPRITLRLVRPGRFGDEVAFSPPAKFSFNPFAKNEVAEDLMIRVDKARLQRAG